MPGLTFVCDFSGRLCEEGAHLVQRLAASTGAPGPGAGLLLHEPHYALDCAAHEDYPVDVFDRDGLWIYLEGCLYGKDEAAVRAEVSRVARLAFDDRETARGGIRRWLLSADGDFIIVAHHKASRQVAILNDVLGRLPLYYHRGDRRFILSRDPGGVAALADATGVDRMAIAQLLVLRYALGERTLAQGVSRLGPATLIVARGPDAAVEMAAIHRFNFDAKAHRDKPVRANARALASRFCQSCERRRHPRDGNVLALSGGLDCRSILAAFRRVGAELHTATYRDADLDAGPDIKVAEELARTLGLDWRLFDLPAPKGKDHLASLEMKDGNCSLTETFYLPFLEQVKQAFGPGIRYFTGDGGDKQLPLLAPARRVKNLDELATYLIEHTRVLSIDDASELTGLPQGEIAGEVKRRLASYPETDLDQKYLHFFVHERGMKWLWEIEDERRFLFWTVAPFYSAEFFDYAMNCPNEQKSLHGLYREFLLALSPGTCAVADANVRLPITSRWYGVARRILAALQRSPRLWRLVRRLLRTTLYRATCGPDSNHIRCLREQLRGCPQIGDVLSVPALERMFASSTKHTRLEFEAILTATSAIERRARGESTFLRYLEKEFI